MTTFLSISALACSLGALALSWAVARRLAILIADISKGPTDEH